MLKLLGLKCQKSRHKLLAVALRFKKNTKEKNTSKMTVILLEINNNKLMMRPVRFYSHTNPNSVLDFVNSTKLNYLSIKETLRHIN